MQKFKLVLWLNAYESSLLATMDRNFSRQAWWTRRITVNFWHPFLICQWVGFASRVVKKSNYRGILHPSFTLEEASYISDKTATTVLCFVLFYFRMLHTCTFTTIHIHLKSNAGYSNNRVDARTLKSLIKSNKSIYFIITIIIVLSPPFFFKQVQLEGLAKCQVYQM